MSAFTFAKVKMTDMKALQKALQRMDKKEWEYHEEATALYGYHGDKREQKANLILRRKHVGMSSNDLGFVRQADGTIQAIISDFDSSRYNKGWLQKVHQEYALVRIEEELAAQGYFLDQVDRRADGKIYIDASNPYDA